MGSEKGNPNRCGHSWRKLRKRELRPHASYGYDIICRLCGTMAQIPHDMLQHFDVYFPSFPGDDED